jgi:DNA polymerase
MSLAREDMLRELELLPVWRLRAPIEANALPASAELTPAIPEAEGGVEKNVDALPDTVMIEPAITAPLADDSPVSVPAIAIEPLEAIAAPLIQSPWLVLCPQASDAAVQQLLQNIVHALKLPPEVLHIAQQEIKVTQVQSRFCILFGLEAANGFLGTSHADLASVRGQLLIHGDMIYVITHHPHAMLENPLLKKEAWHDLCLVLAEK